MAYQALYRKWRPTTFDDVRGQDAVAGTLKNQIRTQRVGHAYLFCGTRGCGKTSVAKIMARAVNCPNALQNGGNPCNECPVCRSISAGSSMNVFEIDAASNNGVDNIRDIKDQVEYPPTEGNYKVYIIDEVHMLSAGAFNALLKTLEEPPAYVIFILATTDPQKVPQTILSRCQRYDFRRMGKATITGYIDMILQAEGFRAEPKAVDYIAEAADGSMRDSLSILDQCLSYARGEDLTYQKVLEVLGAADTGVFSDLFRALCRKDAAKALSVLDTCISEGKEPGLFVNDFVWYLRNLLLFDATKGGDGILDVTEDSLSVIRQDAAVLSRFELIELISSLAELQNRMRFASQKRVLLEVELIRLTSLGTPARTAERPAAAPVRTVPAADPVPVTKSAPAAEHPAAAVPAQSVPAAQNTAPTTQNPAPAAQQVASTTQNLPPTTQNLPPADSLPKEPAAAPTQIGEKLEIIRANWDRLLEGLSPANRVLFTGTVLKEERGGILIIFKNRINFNLASVNSENGLVKLSNLALRDLGVNVRFLARVAKANEFPEEKQVITDEDLKKINFPVDIE